MPTVESSIEAALFARVASLVAVGSPLAGLPVAWPNVAFTRPSDAFLRVTHVPNRNVRRQIKSDGAHLYRGLLQIDVFTPLHAGIAAGSTHAGKVADHFPTDIDLIAGNSVVRVTKRPDIAQSFPGDTHWQTPVTIDYQTSG